MRAVIKTKSEAGAELIDTDIPRPKPLEVLVKIETASICGTDVHIYKWDSWAQTRIKHLPQILGHEFSGKIVETGEEIKEFKVGDFVSAETHIFCGACAQCENNQRHLCANLKILGIDCNGCFAEYIALPAKVLWKNNPSLAPEIACLKEPLGNAVYCVSAEEETVRGKDVVILGDGPAGLLATGVAKAEGARTIILVGENEFCLEIGTKMGADLTIKYTADKDVANAVLECTRGIYPAIVLEMAGTKAAIELALKVVGKGGRISAFGIPAEKITLDYAQDLVFKGIRIYAINGRKIWDTWRKADALLQSGALDIAPIITHRLPLEEFRRGFSLMMERPKIAGKVILFP